MTEKIYKNFINGEWLDSTTRETFPDFNPADCNKLIGYFQASSVDDARNAIQAAKSAFKKWKNTLPTERARIFSIAANLMRENMEEFANTITLEQGKTFNEALKEVNSTIKDIEFLSGEGFRSEGRILPSEKTNTFTYYIRQPLGVVSIITPWNYPIAIPNWKIVPALIIGNTVVFKPASNTPLIALKYVELLYEAGLPKGVLNLVTGLGCKVGKELTENSDVNGISFTGSAKTGLELSKRASKCWKKYQGELGGKNAVIIWEDADIDLFFKDFHSSVFGVSGQKCTATSRIIIHQTKKDEFVKRLFKYVKAIKVGDGLDPNINMGPLTDEAQMETVLRYITIGKEEGATLFFGGNRIMDKDHIKGFFIEPTIFTDVNPKMRIAKEEIFGPVLSILTIDSFKKAMAVLNGIDYGLSASIYTNNLNIALRFIEESEVGIAHVNISTNYIEPSTPFGGIKKSGIGQKERGVAACDFFTNVKTVYLKY